MVRQVKRKGLKDKTLKWVSQTWEKCESSVTYTTLLGCQVQSECAVYMCVHSIVDPCKWHCNLQPMIMGNSMKREQQNLIRLDFVIVTFIIIARLSKLTDLQRDRENTAGKKYQTVYKFLKKVSRWMFFRHIYAWEASGDKAISSHHAFHRTKGF